MTIVSGFNKRNKYFFDAETPTCICYCACINCGNKWQVEFRAWAVTSASTQKKYEYCTSCCPDGNAPVDTTRHKGDE